MPFSFLAPTHKEEGMASRSKINCTANAKLQQFIFRCKVFRMRETAQWRWCAVSKSDWLSVKVGRVCVVVPPLIYSFLVLLIKHRAMEKYRYERRHLIKSSVFWAFIFTVVGSVCRRWWCADRRG